MGSVTEAERIEGMRAEIERLHGVIRRQKRELDDCKLRFKDRDAYCRLLEAELIPYRRAGTDPQLEQDSML